MADNRNAGWRGRFGWGEGAGARGSFGEGRYDMERYDDRFGRGGAVEYNNAGPAQGGYGDDYDRYRGERSARDHDRRFEDYRGADYGPGRRADRGGDYYGDYERHGRGRGRRWEGRPAETRSFGDPNDYVQAVTDGREDELFGEHRGRGPKGYRRADERIREDVNDRLTDDSWLDAREIDVQVADGEVTLSGTVDSRRAKRRAEDIVERVAGVSDVQNNLRVRRDEDDRREDLATPTV